MIVHKPVLTDEVLEYLDPKPNEHFVDCTVGEAGHTLLILQKNGPQGKVLGIDRDAEQIENSKKVLADFTGRAVLVNDSYANIKEIIEREQFGPVSGILADLGYSSWHVEASGKGFSFLKDESLDMRYDTNNQLTAKEIVNRYRQDELEKILEEYGEEKFARKIVKKIIEERSKKSIESTFQLKEIIESAAPGNGGGIHVATRTFQALRIAVNDELWGLAKFLPDAFGQLAPGGRLVIISFHSLEDRIVKTFFKAREEAGDATILTKKPVVPSEGEVVQNPRSRSAKLRALAKI